MPDGQEKYIMGRTDYLDSLASEDETIVQELERIRGELLLIRKEKMKGVLVRSKSRWIEDGERPTGYFCGLEKRQYSK